MSEPHAPKVDRVQQPGRRSEYDRYRRLHPNFMIRLARLRTYDFAKRIFDVLASAIVLVVVAPVVLVVGALVAANLGRPIVFVQDRTGLHGRIFRMYKFRTMKVADESRELVTDEQRLTSFGRMLRSTSLDELPSLWNVVRGDMSIVGPRPLLVRYLDRYTPAQARRHEVRPGVTGLAQVRGRNALTWEQKFQLDVEYVDSRSLRRDMGIILATVRSVLVRDGISAEGHATMEEFRGVSASERDCRQLADDWGRRSTK